MRFLTFSDTHAKVRSEDDPGWNLLMDISFIAEREKVDLILCGGDLVEPGSGILDNALHAISDYRVPVLWVIGNNDLEALETKELSRYAEIAHQRTRDAGTHNVHVLDHRPFCWRDEVVFVGNYVGYDGSLYSPGFKDPRRHELMAQLADIHREAGLDMSPMEVFEMCRGKLEDDLEDLDGSVPCVICTHTVPDSRFLKYGHSEKYDDYNVAMGWDDGCLVDTPGLRYQFCGHTHRAQQVDRQGAPPIINLGMNQVRIFEV